MADTKTPLEANRNYHIYNHAVGNELLFKTEDNYRYFLEKVKKYLPQFVDIYAYCLMPNHFHFLLKVKQEEDVISSATSAYPNKAIKQDVGIPKIISNQFSHLFNTYAQAFNKENNRKGSLFYNRFKRILVEDDVYLKKLIHYIHYNPVNHKFVKKVDDWEHSSYKVFLSTGKTLIKRKEVIELFGDIDNFKYCHTVEPMISGIE